MNLLFALLFFLSSIARADEVVATIQKGQPAPFAGTLLNAEASASLAANLEFSKEKCDIEIAHKINILNAETKLEVDTVTASLSICETRQVMLNQIYENQISQLESSLAKQKKTKDIIWFSSGITGGIIVTLASAWALNLASQ